MRWLIPLLVITLLSGCFAPEEEEDEAPALFGTCPDWIAGSAQVERTGTGDLMIDPVGIDNQTVLVWQERPLDVYLLEMQATGPVQVRAHHADSGERRLMIHHETPAGTEAKLVLNIDNASAEAHVFLSPVEHGSAPDPGRLRLQVTPLEANATLTVAATPFYRVCGVPA